LRIVRLLDAKFEYLGEDVDSPNAKIWKVEAIHVTTTRNKRMFTQAELEASGRSLSFRPLNINHDELRQMPFPENSTRAMHFNPKTMAVEGSFRVTDPAVNAMIETGRINSVSIEQIPTLGETCNEVQCEQHGVAFIGMALLEDHMLPGDPHTVNKIFAESWTDATRTDMTTTQDGTATLTMPNPEVKIESLLISDGQRTCKECTDHQKCDICKHNTEQDDDCVSRMIKKLSDEDKSRPRDQIIAIAFSKCRDGESTKKEAWEFYQKANKILTEIWTCN